MPRPKRIDYPGAWHHVMHRGAREAPIFKADEDCTLFLDTIGDAVDRTGLEVHGYSLMPNHFHLLVRSPNASLGRAMKHLLGVYTQRLNRRYSWDGPVFRGRYRSLVVADDRYLRYLFAYIHLNPLRAHLVGSLDEPCWTSHRAHLGLEGAPRWLSHDGVASWFGTPEAMADWTRRLHVGSEGWPEGMELSADLPLKAIGATAGKTAPTPLPAVDALLATVSEVTGASLEMIREPRRGRAANPARRFAVEVLVWHGALSHRAVADALRMPVRQVANVLHRAKTLPPTPPISVWRDALAER
ncbi:MAG: hypothetical protein CVU56_01375 [Deltaproteobacteria bacterium HGW-Deltaproteobacteria-14]|jgi:REP element-mobilizing transposase RayT|nr:MAG: hypothetical protein CVU56_01375 [Deltaproteobacteria bacterium HGW-Deltaproteobacteria-14]